jgi:hypothetical protein
MSFAFRKHNYNLDEFERCPEHGCIVMRVVAEAKPVCLLDWLNENAAERTVRDVILRGKGEYDLPAVILDNGFLLPVKRAVDVVTGNPQGEVNESVLDWRVTDILYLRGENQEGVAVELLPDGSEADDDPGFLLYLDLQILTYLLFDAEIRKYEP